MLDKSTDSSLNKQTNEYKWMKFTGITIATVWFGFWMYFAIASSIYEKMFADIILIGAVVGIPYLLIWVKEHLGGMVLIIESLIIMIGYPYLTLNSKLSLSTIILTDLMLGLCPLAAGLLFVIRWHKMRVRPLRN